MCSYTDIFIFNPLKIRLNSVGRGVETVQSGDKMATAELGGGPGGGGRGDGVAGWQQLQDQQQWEVVAAVCRDTEHSTEI